MGSGRWGSENSRRYEIGEIVMILPFCLTLAIATAGGFLARRLKIPAGMLLGAIIAVAITNIFTGQMYFSHSVRFFTRVLVGMYMGALIDIKDLMNLPHLRREAVIMLAGLLTTNIAIGFLISKMTSLSLITALLANAPGGIQELSLLAVDMGGDPALVTPLQLFRQIISVSLLPVFIEWFTKKTAKQQKGASNETIAAEDTAPVILSQEDTERGGKSKVLDFCLMAMVSVVFSAIFQALGIPSGAMLGALLGILLLKLLKHAQKLPRSIRFLAQILSGAYIGSMIGSDQVSDLGEIFLPIFVMLICTLLVNILLSFVIYKLGRIDLRSAMYSCAPGGLAEISMLIVGTGVNVTTVTSMHLLRRIAVVSIFPLVFKWLVQSFS
jgi:membrane AbrB-like protein